MTITVGGGPPPPRRRSKALGSKRTAWFVRDEHGHDEGPYWVQQAARDRARAHGGRVVHRSIPVDNEGNPA